MDIKSRNQFVQDLLHKIIIEGKNIDINYEMSKFCEKNLGYISSINKGNLNDLIELFKSFKGAYERKDYGYQSTLRPRIYMVSRKMKISEEIITVIFQKIRGSDKIQQQVIDLDSQEAKEDELIKQRKLAEEKQKAEEKLLRPKKLQHNGENRGKVIKKITFLLFVFILILVIGGIYLGNEEQVLLPSPPHTRNTPLPNTGLISCVIEIKPQGINYYIIQRSSQKDYYVLKEIKDYRREDQQVDASRPLSAIECKKAVINQLLQEAGSGFDITKVYVISRSQYKNDVDVKQYFDILKDKSIDLVFFKQGRGRPIAIEFLLSRPYYD